MIRHRILIVDDDDDVRESLLDELRPSYDVEAVACGKAALASLGSSPYDVVISDQRMPDLTGIEVLEGVRRFDPNIVRILITGCLDEDARRATLVENAPYKIGKPWHDQLEVTLRRALENREATQRLSTSVSQALAAGSVDDELANEEGLAGIARVLVHRAELVPGIAALAVHLMIDGSSRVIDSAESSTRSSTRIPKFADLQPPSAGDDRWWLDEAISTDGTARVVARGHGAAARQITLHLIGRVRRWANEDPATRLARRASADPEARERLMAVTRRAALGGMAASILHEFASVMQSLQLAVGELEPFVRERAVDQPEVLAAIDEVSAISDRTIDLFRSMRAFVQAGERRVRPCFFDELAARAATLCAGYVRGRASMSMARLPHVEVNVDEPLIVQVLVNLVRNAVEAGPGMGRIDVEASLDGDAVELRVTDDGPGVSDSLRARLFEPFVTSKDPSAGTGLGLAFSAQVMREHGGSIVYRRAPGRGACFVLRLPLAAANHATDEATAA